ncbi:hypothetical protein FRB93_010903 [Tulasnella sp. JGI-2019a]|nr:hypothetical protein FRB93_010903 [Tulasnella sp. JGI-2019a]
MIMSRDCFTEGHGPSFKLQKLTPQIRHVGWGGSWEAQVQPEVEAAPRTRRQIGYFLDYCFSMEKFMLVTILNNEWHFEGQYRNSRRERVTVVNNANAGQLSSHCFPSGSLENADNGNESAEPMAMGVTGAPASSSRYLIDPIPSPL